MRSEISALVLLAGLVACDGAMDSTADAGPGGQPEAGWRDSGPPAGADTDGDGLDDAWEFAAGDATQLDWQLADTDDDGVLDGDEDPDGDGLTNLQEQAAAALPRYRDGAPHPLRRDLLVELDAMRDRALASVILDDTVAVFAALALPNADGSTGVGLHLYPDQQDIEPFDLSGDFGQRHQLFGANGPRFPDALEGAPLDRMIHVMVVTRRTDIPTRAGDTVGNASGNIEQSGVLIYRDAIEDVHPACGRQVEPRLPDITVAEALAATLAHELGHTLQLGHDTAVGGGVNPYNLMSVPASCVEAQQRIHGDGNSDPSLGATEETAAPRFSQAATDLLDFDHVISVSSPDFLSSSGNEM